MPDEIEQYPGSSLLSLRGTTVPKQSLDLVAPRLLHFVRNDMWGLAERSIWENLEHDCEVLPPRHCEARSAEAIYSGMKDYKEEVIAF